MKAFKLKPVHFVIFGVVIGLGGFFLLLANPFGLKTPKPFFQTTATPSPAKSNIPPGAIAAPTPTLILPSGRQSFHVQGGDNDFSKVKAIVVDPLDAQKGQNQTIDITVNSIEPVSKFTITLTTDNATNTFTPTLISGDATNGTWEASYSFPDTSAAIYEFVFDMNTTTNKQTHFTFPVR